MGKEKVLNAPKHPTMDSMRDDPRNYLTGGHDVIDAFAAKAIEVLCGKPEDDMVILPGGTFGRAMVTLPIRVLGANGGHIVAANNLFGGTWGYLALGMPTYGAEVSFVSDINDPDELRAALRPYTRLFLCEVTSNPMLVVTDLKQVIGIVRECSPEAIVVVDDTVNAGIYTTDDEPKPFSPLGFDADVVVYSCTKHIAGEGDERGGLIIGRNRELPAPIVGKERLMDALTWVQRLEGVLMHPEVACTLTERIGGLYERQVEACENAEVFARTLVSAESESGTKIYHPSLPSHATHENVRKNGMVLSGSLVTVDVGSMEKAAEVGNAWAKAGIVTPSNSFGEPITLAEAVAFCMPQHAELLKSMGIAEGIIRVSLGWGDEVSFNIVDQAEEAAQILKKLTVSIL